MAAPHSCRAPTVRSSLLPAAVCVILARSFHPRVSALVLATFACYAGYTVLLTWVAAGIRRRVKELDNEITGAQYQWQYQHGMPEHRTSAPVPPGQGCAVRQRRHRCLVSLADQPARNQRPGKGPGRKGDVNVPSRETARQTGDLPASGCLRFPQPAFNQRCSVAGQAFVTAHAYGCGPDVRRQGGRRVFEL